ncbi:MAG TPA: N-acetyl-gamma-glutamyl-phosphate reductase [Alphaproteobacteria bacterium]|nr:N-acetyl-gamma-glutamyl-phosphate reductase [Alphaproteobacteria bacterium]USO04701.1 MAG: N-acetyl-gamma-glutamyl-phosphate reductase [Rhodospirillales bacterium]HOO82725.1 N-acetyl-gamma-glutamyl-phosphate reductase [Alphaproteobacteria bacterium]
MIKASIIGITGYTGLEQLRMLLAHPNVEIVHLTSRQHQRVAIGEVYPHLAHLDLTITNTDHMKVAEDSDVVFLALPHKTAQDIVADLHGSVKVIDLSADYRLDDAAVYEKYYTAHNHPELLKEVVYGAPEFNAEKIAVASTVSNPGCFALLAQLMLYPFAGLIERADIMAVTGSSGSGKSASDGTHHPVRNHNMKSYNINKHRHIPEITRSAQIDESQLNFVPTSGPFSRGIFASAFVHLKADIEPLDLAEQAYNEAPFVRLQDTPALANVVGSNFCDLSFVKGVGQSVIVQGALDNLVKGAAGCAVQNMNLMFGLDETAGLDTLTPLYP